MPSMSSTYSLETILLLSSDFLSISLSSPFSAYNLSNSRAHSISSLTISRIYFILYSLRDGSFLICRMTSSSSNLKMVF
jgi:hypothetical protein